MEKFLDNLKMQAEANPIVALGVAAAVISAVGKFIEQAGHAKGSRAYARAIDHKIRRSPRPPS